MCQRVESSQRKLSLINKKLSPQNGIAGQIISTDNTKAGTAAHDMVYVQSSSFSLLFYEEG